MSKKLELVADMERCDNVAAFAREREIANWFSDTFVWAVDIALWLARIAIALALTFAGGLIVKAYSRRRKFRADAFAARLVGHGPMIAALTSIAKDDATIPRRQLGCI